jgi:hypothetical protein
LKCSNSITNGTYPKPTEVPWNKDLCNSVNLIGFVADPVEIKHFPSGKVVARTRLSVKKNATQMSWIHLKFWDELAHVASQHVQQGQHIHVFGRLVTDTVDSVEGKQQTYYKVFLLSLVFVLILKVCIILSSSLVARLAHFKCGEVKNPGFQPRTISIFTGLYLRDYLKFHLCRKSFLSVMHVQF